MDLVFLGTPAFAVPTLERIFATGHRVLAVYTQPDRPRGRGQELTAPPVKQVALAHGVAVHQPERIRRPEVVAQLAALRPEVMVVVGYGQIIPQSIIDIPPLGIINVHASLLPGYRGAAPVQWAVARGETTTGVTTMRIDAGLDTGEMLLWRATPIAPEEDAVALAGRLSVMGADLLVETLEKLRSGSLTPVKQDSSRATLAPILRKEDGLIDWNLPAPEICNRVRGLVPWPGAYTWFRGQRLHIWKARAGFEGAATPVGTLVAAGRRLGATCGEGTFLEMLEVQLEGRKRITGEAFLNGQHVEMGERLGDIQK